LTLPLNRPGEARAAEAAQLAAQAFRTGSERPNGEGTEPGYWSTKESVNSAVFGQVYMRAATEH
jgi:hypothetical protein